MHMPQHRRQQHFAALNPLAPSCRYGPGQSEGDLALPRAGSATGPKQHVDMSVLSVHSGLCRNGLHSEEACHHQQKPIHQA